MSAATDFRGPVPAQCDAVVIGAGPAGLCAALNLVRSGVGTVVLLDRRDPWREPVACAEAVDKHLVDARLRIPDLERLVGVLRARERDEVSVGVIDIDVEVGDLSAPAGEVTMGIRKELTDIQYGRLPDRHGWLVKLRD